MTDPDAPYHAHIYYDPAERPAAAALRDALAGDPAILLVGPMTDRPIGPHPCPQYEVHFRACSVEAVTSRIEAAGRSEEHTSELQSLMRISYAVFCLKKKKERKTNTAR